MRSLGCDDIYIHSLHFQHSITDFVVFAVPAT